MKDLQKLYGNDHQKKLDLLKKLSEDYNRVTKDTYSKLKLLERGVDPEKFRNAVLGYEVHREKILNALKRRVKSVNELFIY